MGGASAIVRHLRGLAGGLLCSTALAAPAWAEDGGVGGFLQQVLDNATYQSELVFTAYPRGAHQADSKGIEDENLEAWSHLSLDSSTFIGDYWSFGLGVEAVASTYRGAERGFFTPPGSRSGDGRFIDLSRLTLSYLGDTVEILMGKDEIPLGVAELYSPTDLYNQSNLAHPQQAVDFGVWQARADVYLDSGRLTGIILPVEEAAPGPADHSRWSGGSGSSGGSEFANLDIRGLPPNTDPEIHDDLRGSAPSEWGYLVQYKATATGLDYYVTGYNGPSPYPVLKAAPNGPANRFLKVYPRVTIASAGAALTEGSWKFYGESMGYLAADDRDEDLARMLLGVKYRETRLANQLGLDEISPVLEYAKEWRFDEQSHDDYRLSSAEARPNPNNLLMSLTVNIDNEWKVGGLHNQSLSDDDSLSTLFVRYQPNDNLWLALSGTEYHGRDDTRFGRYSRHDNIELEVNYSF